ncbi:MAG: L-threonine 3-dehydrogenase [bacterium]|nr:L-threonine 3-dehydrogenase [bacterium]
MNCINFLFMKMKSIRKINPQLGATLVDIEVPKPSSYEVLVKVKATSICGTDVHIYSWNEWAQNRIKNLPQTMGHEFAGEIVEVGSCVKNIKVGDYVSAETHIPCGGCIQCMTGQMHICHNVKILGVDCDGCFAEYITVPESVIWKNDKSIPPEFASVQEPIGNAVYCTLVEPVTAKTVVILGAGPTGLFSTGVAKVAGAAQVIVVEVEQFRLDIAKKMGADICINPKNEDPLKRILDETKGIGADVVLDMAGSPKTIELAIKAVRRGGRFSAFGITPGVINIDYNSIIFKGVTIYGISGRLMFDTWFKVRNLLAYKKLDISPVITHKLKLEEFDKGFSEMINKTAAKVILFP